MRSARVEALTPAQHRDLLASQPDAGFLQVPAWARVKPGWSAESVGWCGADGPLGAALVLYRRLPGLRRSLAYVPEGPALDWSAGPARAWLDPLVDHVRGRGAFALRIGPPVAVRRWSAGTVRRALADPAVRTLDDVPADEHPPGGAALQEQLRAAGWRREGGGPGFAVGQPRHVMRVPVAGRSDDELLAGMNQAWRRNLRRAGTQGVEVVRGGADDLPAFHRLYVHTAERDGFAPRPLAYLVRLHEALSAEPAAGIDVWLARHAGELAAAVITIRVGTTVWYAYGASSTARRDARPSNALQWRALRAARDAGAAVYDLRGVTGTLDAADPHVGLTRFKAGLGAGVVELAGEWTLPLSRTLTAAFDAYLRRRGG